MAVTIGGLTPSQISAQAPSISEATIKAGMTRAYASGRAKRGGLARYKKYRSEIEKAQAEAKAKAEAEARRIAEELARKKAEQQRLLLAQQQKATQQKITAGTIGGQVTRTDLTPEFDFTGRVHTTPSIYQTQVGEFKVNGDIIPVTQTVSGKFVGLPGSAKVWTETPATKEERAYFEERTNVLVASEGKPSFVHTLTGGRAGSVGDIYRGAEKTVRESITDPTIGRLFEKIDYEHGKTDLTPATEFFAKKPVWYKPSLVETLTGTDIYKESAIKGQLMAGAGLGILEDVRTKPLKSAVIYGAGFGLGVATSGISAGLSAVPKIGGGLASTFKIGQIGAGVYFGSSYGLTVAQQVKSAKDITQIGSVLGVAGKDIALGGIGFAKGQASAIQLRGWWATRGREELILQQGVYPTAPTKTHLKLFKESVIPELGTKPGAFHTTSKIFWKKGMIKPLPGTSELPGLYGGTQISTPFARIKGSGSYKLFPSLKDLFFVSGKPGVAYLKPEGFRYSPYAKVSKYYIGEQAFKYGFKYPPKPGYADIPLMKTEIEAIFRPGTGSYLLESGKYFVTIKGVRVPIDVFGYGGKVVTAPPGVTPKIFGRGVSSYELPPSSYSIISPSSLAISSYVSRASSDVSSSGISSAISKVYSKPSRVSRVVPRSRGYSILEPSRSYAPSLAPSSYTPYYSYKKTPPRKISPFILPRPKIRFREKSKRARQLFPQPTRYQASFTAAALNLRGTVPKGYEKLAFGGLRLRPIVDTPIQRRIKRTRII